MPPLAGATYCQALTLLAYETMTRPFDPGHVLVQPLTLLASLAAVDRLAPNAGQSGVPVADDVEDDAFIDRIHNRVAQFLSVPKDDVDVSQPINRQSTVLTAWWPRKGGTGSSRRFEVNISSRNLFHPTNSYREASH